MAKGIYVGVAEDSLVVNGDFSNELNGWEVRSTSYLSSVAEEGMVKTTVTTATTSALYTVLNTAVNTPIVGHVYYYCADMKATLSKGALRITYADNYVLTNKKNGTWEFISNLFTLTKEVTASDKMRVGFILASGEVGDIVYCDNVKLYDLTALYGAGNEPTKAWCDANLETLKTLYKSKTGVARKVKKLYVGVDNKARKVKKGYIGVGGVAKLFFSAETLVPFTTCPYASMSWNTVNANTKYQGTNDYGKWTVEASSSAGSSYTVYNAFDADTSDYWISAAMTTDDYVSCAIYLPEGVSINPTAIYISYGQFKNASVQGLNESTGTWETIESLSNTTANSTTKNLSPTVTGYYTAFRVYGTRYSSGYNDPRVSAFSIGAGTLKIE